jgi:hypothetical protein
MKKLIIILIGILICFLCPFVGYWKGYNDANKGHDSIFGESSNVVTYEQRYATVTGLNTSDFYSGEVVYFDNHGIIKKLNANDTINYNQLIGFVTWSHPASGSISIFTNKNKSK